MKLQSQNKVTVKGKVYGGDRLLICVPLISANVTALLEDAKKTCAYGPDIIEWRADFFENLSDAQTVAQAANRLGTVAGDIPILFTVRHPAENGVSALSDEDKKAVIKAVCATGAISLVDLELRYDDDYIAEVRDITRRNGVALVLSYHNFSGMSDMNGVQKKIERAEQMGADISKLALMPKDFHDVAVFSKTICAAKRSYMKNPIIASLMGDIGGVSRFAGGLLGSDMSFVSVTGISGPGQMHIEDFRILNNLMESNR